MIHHRPVRRRIAVVQLQGIHDGQVIHYVQPGFSPAAQTVPAPASPNVPGLITYKADSASCYNPPPETAAAGETPEPAPWFTELTPWLAIASCLLGLTALLERHKR